MRTLLKYISLLVISGLILPFYKTFNTHKPNVAVSQENTATNSFKMVSDTSQMQYFDLWHTLKFAVPALKK